jgi:alkyl sulfatase BDS1-like metallo-beta-lactamase superfamily hydrolase
MKNCVLSLTLVIMLGFFGCQTQTETGDDAQGHTPPTDVTAKANADIAKQLPIKDQRDFEEARRGFIATDPNLVVKAQDGNTIWNQPAYGFIQGNAPASVNPSLWRQAKLNNIHGLFKVTQGVYQLRGFDLANMTLIEGKTGWIIVDPLTSKETSIRAFSFATQHLGKKPIKAIIFTHSHVDHFGGALGILSSEDIKSQNVRIIAPQGFLEESVSENIIAGIGMSRRSIYMYGSRLARSERGHVGSGLGKEPAVGAIGILRPTEIINQTPQELEIDGIRLIFQYTPASEAPAELTFYLPDLKTFCGAEIVSRNLHNLYTLRGTKVRDALKWSNYIDEAIYLFGEADVYFGTHHWPVWGNELIIDFLKKQRDIYKYIHDQTMRLANSGYTPKEIAEQLDYPESLKDTFSVRGYYGTISHNSKAVYQHYFGWYDGNPAHLNPLPPVEAASKYVEYMGGADNVLRQARASFDKGEYRWVAEVLNHLVFAAPNNQKATSLLAKTYDQLGYQSESGPWRDVYLTGAYELRHGGPEKTIELSNALDMLKQTPMSNFLDAMAVRLNGPKADGKEITINIIFTDLNESYVLNLENAVLHHRQTTPNPKANATVKLTHDLYLNLAIGRVGIKDLITSDDIEYSGSKLDLIRFFALFDKPKPKFNIVTP